MERRSKPLERMAHSKSRSKYFNFLPFCNRNFLEFSRENSCGNHFLEKIPFASIFSRKFLLQYFSRENSCGNFLSRKFMYLVGRLSGCFYAFNIRKSEFLGTVDRNIRRNSLENSREIVRNQEEKLTGIFSRIFFFEKIRLKTGEKPFSRKIL